MAIFRLVNRRSGGGCLIPGRRRIVRDVKAPIGTVATLVVAGLLVGCSSTAAPTTPSGDGLPSRGATGDAQPATSGEPSQTSSSASASSAVTAAGGTKPASEGPKEVAKDANALVLELTIESSKGAAVSPGDNEKLKAAFVAKVAESSKIAMPTSVGVTAGRHVATRLIVDALTEGKDGLTQKVQLNGVTADGKRPLFDLNAKATLSEAHKDKPADVDEVRAAAIAQVFQKLEAEAPTLKPSASCSSEKKKK